MSDFGTHGNMGPRADFRPDIFDNAIVQKGYRAIWEQGMLCACHTATSRQPDFNCPTCKGIGYVYFDPKETRVLVSSISGRKEQEKIGLNELGTAYVTPRASDEMGFRDRLTFPDFTMKYSQILRRGKGVSDQLRYPATSFICLRTVSKEYKRGIDFNLSKDKWSIEWITNPLTEGEPFSVLYSTPAVYILINPIHELRGTFILAGQQGLEKFVQLPRQFQIKREDFLDAETGIPGNQRFNSTF